MAIRIARKLAVPLAVLALAACSSPEEIGDKVGVKQDAATPAGGATARAGVAADAEARSVKEETDLYQFELAWPKEVSAIPALAARLEAVGKASRKQLIDDAQDQQEAAKENKFPYRALSYGEQWKVVANLPGWLSLTEDVYSYTGGAHGNYGRDSLVWDKAAGEGHSGIDLFASPEVLQSALGDRLCDALDAERLRKRGADYVSSGIDEFDQCPGISDATVIVGSSNKQTFDRIRIYFGPYVAGPYAEGDYELTFPVDANVLDAVKPAYRSAFSIKR
ncbi:DUF4163 domain-containing protein [Altererythrobacter salegens]|uniref:DUF4163 domain-containing protein n=1 Tax=Croceibacterium salegens TaxID=1737568 RepID=A0A6I4SRL3_9SPHN|nr:DUF3298 and DUF4163 domain-containing protein [Croceibacterium salegens]MXO58048.1 DUF4163 domain-containing protein [Croceibacterium salegens]